MALLRKTWWMAARVAEARAGQGAQISMSAKLKYREAAETPDIAPDLQN